METFEVTNLAGITYPHTNTSYVVSHRGAFNMCHARGTLRKVVIVLSFGDNNGRLRVTFLSRNSYFASR